MERSERLNVDRVATHIRKTVGIVSLDIRDER
jgi:hypothetical protein